VRGAQVQLWSEYIATNEHLDYMAFPRTAVFAEVAWGTQESLDTFRPRLARHLERLTAMGVHFRPLDER
jgi:hexosaminidase